MRVWKWVAIAAVGALGAWWLTSRRDPPRAEYADANSCAACHAKIAATYRTTGMGRSFGRVRAEGAERAQYVHEASERSYAVGRRDGRLIFRRSLPGLDGAESNVIEREAHFVLGSGNHSQAYLHRKPDGRLVELPLGWYAEGGGHWAMNPGFDRPDHDDFRREIMNYIGALAIEGRIFDYKTNEQIGRAHV